MQPISVSTLSKQHIVLPGTKVNLKKINPSYTGDFKNEEETLEILEANKKRLFELLEIIHAEKKCAWLIILQGMNASGKDGTIKKVLTGVNPRYCQVTDFRVPSEEERMHDYLWRIHKHIPPIGSIGIFHRSQYEDVIVPRIKNQLPLEVIRARFEQINNFEKMLSENSIKILKFLLQISNREQLRRISRRIEDPNKNYKFSISDLEENAAWDRHIEAYEDILNYCSTEWAPWYIIPANNKWFKNQTISQILVEELENHHCNKQHSSAEGGPASGGQLPIEMSQLGKDFAI